MKGNTMTTTMRLNLQQHNLRPLDRLDAWVEKQLRALGALRQIDEANVRLVRLLDASPAYRVYVHLVTPGPDVFAKAVTELREQIASRAAKRLQRLKSNLKARRGG